MMTESSGGKIQHRKGEKGQSRWRRGRERESEPFEGFAEVVGRRHELEHATRRDLVTGLPGLAQVAKNVVTMDVDEKTKQEQGHAQEEPRGEKVVVRMLVSEDEGQHLHDTVVGAEGEGEEEGDEGSRLPPGNQKRVDEAPLEVVKEEQAEQNRVRQRNTWNDDAGELGEEDEEEDGEEEGGRLLNEPRHADRDPGPEQRTAALGVAPVWRREEQKDDADEGAGRHHRQRHHQLHGEALF